MKKRVEKVWEWIDSTNSFLTKGKWYAEYLQYRQLFVL